MNRSGCAGSGLSTNLHPPLLIHLLAKVRHQQVVRGSPGWDNSACQTGPVKPSDPVDASIEIVVQPLACQWEIRLM